MATGPGLCGQTLSGIRGVCVIWPTSTCPHACCCSPLPAAVCGLHLKFKWRKISACGARCVQTVTQLPMPLPQLLQASTTQGKDCICNINRNLIPLSAAVAAPLLSLRWWQPPSTVLFVCMYVCMRVFNKPDTRSGASGGETGKGVASGDARKAAVGWV